ncbi:AAA family ATPase [Thalassobacillus hwangdonensis]|uniref:CpaE family protein n=1 Tax=Thalassobacillus hwangdonensis TaxID=546108 RepID=A0ABW3L5B5_9BACI
MTEGNPSSVSKRGELIAVCSAKGGVGRTTLTANLAVALFKKNIQVGVLDGDLQFGDISLALDLHPTFTIKDVIEELDQIDEHTLNSYLSRHDSGVKVLPPPERPEFAELVKVEDFMHISDTLVRMFDYLLVDTGVGLQDLTVEVAEKADQILLVTNLEMATLKNTKLMLETFRKIGLHEKVTIIVNRSNMESVIQAKDVSDILGVNELLYVPNDFQVTSQALNLGIPFVVNQTKAEVSKAIYKMAEQLTSRRTITTFKPAQPSILSKLFSKKRPKEGVDE